MRPLFFVPDVDGRAIPPEEVLGEIATGMDKIQCTGPENKSGRMCAWLTPQDREYRYFPDQQTWTAASGHGGDAGRYYVGISNEKPPTERELLRPDHRRGQFVKLGNDEQWLITQPEHLERYPMPQADGSLVWSVDAKYNSIVTHIDRIKASRVVKDLESSTFIFDDVEDYYFLCSVLQLNYRITNEMVGTMRLFSDQAIREIIAALLGLKLDA